MKKRTCDSSRAGKLIKGLFGCNGSAPFLHIIEIVFFLPFQNGRKAIFTAETVPQRNGPIFAEQALMKEAKRRENLSFQELKQGSVL